MKKLLFFLLLIAMIGISWYLAQGKFFNSGPEVIGWVKYSSLTARSVTIEKENNEESTLYLFDNPKIYTPEGARTNLEAISVGAKIKATGLKEKEGKTQASKIYILKEGE